MSVWHRTSASGGRGADVVANAHTPARLASSRIFVVLCLIVACSATFHLWGIRRKLPMIPQPDEVILYEPAVRIASTGDLNPRWFGYPGSTVIYPTALAAHVWQAVVHGGGWLHVGSQWRTIFQWRGFELVLMGRLVSVTYSLAALIVLFLLGRAVFDTRTALVGTLFAGFCPTIVEYAQQLRTDAPAMFFGVLHLLLCVRLMQRPGWGSAMLAGASLGLGLATRVMMGAVAPVLLVTYAVSWWRDGRAARLSIWQVAAGLACVPLAFAVATPYAVLDPAAAWSSFRELAAKQQGHLGADGLGPAENAWWYVSVAMPLALTWPQMALAVAGILRGLRGRDPATLLTLLYLGSFVGGISLVKLHWDRWLLPVLPLVALYAGYGVTTIVDAIAPRRHAREAVDPRRRVVAAVATAGIAMALVILPTRTLVAAARLRSLPATDVLASKWIAANLPPSSVIVRERYTAEISTLRFVVVTLPVLPRKSLDEYMRMQADYLLTSSGNWMRFGNEPTRYAREIAFYQELHRRALLVKELAPNAESAGPIVRIYALSDRARQHAATLGAR
jgi:hypothetical protein